MPDSGFSSYTSDRPVRRSTERESAKPAAHYAHPLLRLQHQVGNAAVSRSIQRAADEEALQAKHDPAIQRESEGAEAEDEEELQAKHDPAIQREDEGAEAEDEEELQAKHDPAIQREDEGGEAEDEEELQAKHDPAIQREDEGAEAEDEEEIEAKHDRTLQREVVPQVGLEGGPVGPEIESRINSKRGGGSELSASLRGRMESAMGTSFADVRVHRDAESDYLNRSLTAKAFTTGSDIFLRGDVSENDTDTMAHELHHVTQQRTMGGGGGGLSVGAADDTREHEADAAAAAVRSGESVQRHSADED